MRHVDIEPIENVPTVIFDIDGTLADIEHRRPFVTGKKKDFDAFNAAMGWDAVNYPIIELLWMCDDSAKQIIFCTGRMEQFREVTRDFLLDKCAFENTYHKDGECSRESESFTKDKRQHLVAIHNDLAGKWGFGAAN